MFFSICRLLFLFFLFERDPSCCVVSTVLCDVFHDLEMLCCDWLLPMGCEGSRSFIGLIKMEISGRSAVLDRWSFWSTRRLGKFDWSCGRPRRSRSALITTVGSRRRFHVCDFSGLMRMSLLTDFGAVLIVFPSIKVQEHVGNDKSCVWKAPDFADGELKDETFCIRFGSVESGYFCA